MKYDEMRADIEKDRPDVAGVKIVWHVAGVSFIMDTLDGTFRHLVEGKQVSEQFFRDALAQVLPSSCRKEGV